MESPIRQAKDDAAIECTRICELVAEQFAISDGDPDGDGFDKSRGARACAARIRQAFGLPAEPEDQRVTYGLP